MSRAREPRVRQVNVVFEGWGEQWLLGQLAADSTQVLFEYSPQALQRGLELSPHSVKLRAEAYAGFPSYQGRVPGFIADAHPARWGFAPEPSSASSSALSTLQTLAAQGMGALTFQSEGVIEASVDDVFSVLEAAPARVIAGPAADVVAELVARSADRTIFQGRLLTFETQAQQLSTGGSAPGEPWMFQVAGTETLRERCAISQMCAVLGRSMGVPIPESVFIDGSAHQAAFGLKRFDRRQSLRIPVQTVPGLRHTESFEPAFDYRALLRMTRFLTRDEREVRKAFERCVFNVLLNVRNDIGSSFAFLQPDARTWQLAPAHLVQPVLEVGEGQGSSVMGEREAPGRKHLLELARDCGVGLADAERILDRQCAVARGLRSQVDQYPIRRAMSQVLLALVDRNIERVA